MAKQIKIKKSFDKKHYQEIKKFVDWRLRHRSWCSNSDVVGHILMVIELMPDLIKREDYESAQAVKDSIIEFVNSFPGEKIDKDILLKIPSFTEEKEIHCHLSFINKETKL